MADMAVKRKTKKNKILKSYRLDPAIVRAVGQIAKEQSQDETWVVEMILGVSLGLREIPKPFTVLKLTHEAA